MILDQLYDEYEKQGDLESLELLKKISPIRWEHINFVGKYIFTKGLPNTKMVDIINQIKNNLHMLAKNRK